MVKMVVENKYLSNCYLMSKCSKILAEVMPGVYIINVSARGRGVQIIVDAHRRPLLEFIYLTY